METFNEKFEALMVKYNLTNVSFWNKYEKYLPKHFLSYIDRSWLFSRNYAHTEFYICDDIKFVSNGTKVMCYGSILFRKNELETKSDRIIKLCEKRYQELIECIKTLKLNNIENKLNDIDKDFE